MALELTTRAQMQSSLATEHRAERRHRRLHHEKQAEASGAAFADAPAGDQYRFATQQTQQTAQSQATAALKGLADSKCEICIYVRCVPATRHAAR